MHRVAHLHLDVVALAHDTNVRPAQLAQQVERLLRLLTQRQPQAVLLAALADCTVDVLGHTIEPVRGACTVDPLVRTLVVVVAHPVVQTLARVGERSEHRLFEELAPDRLPEPLDLAQGHRVVGR